MALSQATLVQRIRFEQRDLPHQYTGTLANAADTSCAVADSTQFVIGDVIEFLADGDTCLVPALPDATTLTVERSYYGSTATAHAGTAFVKMPRHYFNEITNAISSVIQSRLWPLAWIEVADTLTPPTSNITTTWTDLAATARGLISVRQLHGSGNVFEGRYGPSRRYERRGQIGRNMTTSLVASGIGLPFPDGFYHATNTVNVDYAAKITDAVSGGNYSDLTDGDAIVEAIIFGVVSHLEWALENSKPRQPRQDRETLRGASMYDRKFEDALQRAHQELRDTIPIMSGSKA